MNVGSSGLKLGDLLQTLVKTSTQTQEKGPSKANNFTDLVKDILNETTSSTSVDEAGKSNGMITSNADSTISNDIIKLLASYSKGNVQDGTSAQDTELMNLVKQLVSSLTEAIKSKSQANANVASNDVLNASDKNASSNNGKVDLMGELALLVDLLRVSALNNVDTKSDSSKMSLDKLLDMLTKVDNSSTTNTDNQKISSDNVLNAMAQLLLLNNAGTLTNNNNDNTAYQASLSSILTALTKIDDSTVKTSENKNNTDKTKELLALMLNNITSGAEGNINSESDDNNSSPIPGLKTSDINQLMLLLIAQQNSDKTTLQNSENLSTEEKQLVAAINELKSKISSSIDKSETESSVLKNSFDSTALNAGKEASSNGIGDIQQNASKDSNIEKLESDISKNLATIIDAVENQVKLQNGKVDSDGLKKAYTELINQIKLNDKDTQNTKAQEAMLQKSGQVNDSQQNLKNKLVEVLVALTNADSTITEDSKSSDKAKQFINLLDTAIENNIKDGQTIVKSSGAANSSLNSAQTQTKEDKLLKSVAKISDDSSKVTKVNNFISQLNNNTQAKPVISEEKPVINRQTFNQDIIKTIKYMNINNLKELAVKITPGDLGEITIKLTSDQGNVKASIIANSKETYNLLNSNLNDLSNKLGTNEIKINSLDINIYQEDTTYFNQNNNQGQRRDNQQQDGSNKSEAKDTQENKFADTIESSGLSALV